MVFCLLLCEYAHKMLEVNAIFYAEHFGVDCFILLARKRQKSGYLHEVRICARALKHFYFCNNTFQYDLMGVYKTHTFASRALTHAHTYSQCHFFTLYAHASDNVPYLYATLLRHT